MIRAALDRLYLFAGYLAGLFMIAIFVLMMILSAGRPLGVNLPAGDDLVSWCMAAMAFLGLAHTFRRGEMIRVGLVIDLVTGRARWIMELVAVTIGCAFIGFFGLLIGFVFLSLLLGWATATECAAWGVLGSLAIAWWHGALSGPRSGKASWARHGSPA